MNAHQDPIRDMRLFLTADYPCSYIPGRSARNLVVDSNNLDNNLYAQLVKLGFRRSGNYAYRPHCSKCLECVSLRIPSAAFQPNRAQRRTWNRNHDLDVRCLKPCFRVEHYHLFKRYLKARHPDGGMSDTTPEGYLAFLTSQWSNTFFYEFRLHERLLAVAITDRLEDGLSAVYTFFDPGESSRSLGTYAVLWQIHEAKREGLPWVYLGYWVRDSEKMAYKANYQPHQVLLAGRWVYQ